MKSHIFILLSLAIFLLAIPSYALPSQKYLLLNCRNKVMKIALNQPGGQPTAVIDNDYYHVASGITADPVTAMVYPTYSGHFPFVKKVGLKGTPNEEVPFFYNGWTHVTDGSLDYLHSKLFLLDWGNSLIHLVSTAVSPSSVAQSIQADAIQTIAVDPVGKTLFAASDGKIKKLVYPEGGSAVGALETIKNFSSYENRTLAADPVTKKLFLTKYAGPAGSKGIYRMNYDGSGMELIFPLSANDGVSWISALAIDVVGRRLYYYNPYTFEVYLYLIDSPSAPRTVVATLDPNQTGICFDMDFMAYNPAFAMSAELKSSE